jgi:hypothetical protein
VTSKSHQEGTHVASRNQRTARARCHRRATDDRVAYRWTWTGTHWGKLFGLAATGKEARSTGTTITHIRDDKPVESWTQQDNLALLTALGAATVKQS